MIEFTRLYVHQSFQIVENIRANIDVISSVAYSTFLAGKLFSSIPSIITRSAFLCFNITGFLYLDFQRSLASKVFKDTLYSWHSKEWITLSATAAKTVSVVSDFLLMIIGCAAASAAWLGQSKLQRTLYSVTRPWGVGFLFISIGLEIWHYTASQHALHMANAMRNEQGSFTARELVHAFVDPVQKRGSAATRAAVSRIRAVMDIYAWHKLRDSLRPLPRTFWGIQNVINKLRIELGTQARSGTNTLALRTVGYISLFISKAHPDTLAQAVALCGSSCLYTAHTIYTRTKQSQTWS